MIVHTAELWVKEAQKTMTTKEIADLCSVNEGSVRRWSATGKADLDFIQPLLLKIPRIKIPPKRAADLIMEKFGKRNSFSIRTVWLAKMFGIVRGFDRKFIDSFEDALEEWNISIVILVDKHGEKFLFLKDKDLCKLAKPVEREDLERYFQPEVDEEDDDEV